MEHLGDIYKRYRHISGNSEPAIKTYLMELLDGSISCIDRMDANQIKEVEVKMILPQ